jgi:hypothetical protein
MSFIFTGISQTHRSFPWMFVNCSHNRRGICSSPRWFRKRVILLCILAEQMLYRTRYLLHLPWDVKEVHLIVSLSDFIGDTACPSLNLIQFEILFVISGFANVNLLVNWKSTRTAFVVASEEHYEAAVHNFIDLVISVLPSLDDLILEEVFFVLMDRLLRPVVPACIDPLQSLRILPGTIYLSHNRLCEIIWILEMNPIACNFVSKASY